MMNHTMGKKILCRECCDGHYSCTCGPLESVAPKPLCIADPSKSYKEEEYIYEVQTASQT